MEAEKKTKTVLERILTPFMIGSTFFSLSSALTFIAFLLFKAFALPVDLSSHGGFPTLVVVGIALAIVAQVLQIIAILLLIICAIRSGMAHMPLPIWPRPASPLPRPMATFCRS